MASKRGGGGEFQRGSKQQRFGEKAPSTPSSGVEDEDLVDPEVMMCNEWPPIFHHLTARRRHPLHTAAAAAAAAAAVCCDSHATGRWHS